MADESRKREYRIDSSDSARPPATVSDEPYHYAQGLKPKPRVIVTTEYEELDEKVSRGKNLPMAKLILKTTTYDDGTIVEGTVGEDNVSYKEYLAGVRPESEGTVSTRRHTPTKKPSKASAKKG